VIRNEVLQSVRQRNAKHHGKGNAGLSGVVIQDEAFDSQTIRELEVYELQRAQTIVSQEVPNNVWQAFYLSRFTVKLTPAGSIRNSPPRRSAAVSRFLLNVYTRGNSECSNAYEN
jgi:hypothetical protein